MKKCFFKDARWTMTHRWNHRFLFYCLLIPISNALSFALYFTRKNDFHSYPSRRVGADVRRMKKPYGEGFSLDDVEAALKQHHPTFFFLTHGESSATVVHPIEGIGPLCHKYGVVFGVDTVASLGGTPFYVRWQYGTTKWRVIKTGVIKFGYPDLRTNGHNLSYIHI